MISISSKELFVSNLSDYILSKTIGNHVDDDIIDEKPSRVYLVGSLASRKDVGGDSFDENKAASIRASKIKVSLLIPKKEILQNSDVIIKATGNVYYKLKKSKTTDPSEDITETVKDKGSWKRLTFSNKFHVKLQDGVHELNFDELLETANSDVLIEKKIPENQWNASLSIKSSEYVDKDLLLVSFGLENTSVENTSIEDPSIKKLSSSFEKTLYNCKLEVDLNRINNEEFLDEYLYEKDRQRFFYDFRTMNCQAYWLDKDKHQFVTDHYNKYEQPNILPKDSIPNLNLKFSNLISEDNVLQATRFFIGKMEEYLNVYRKNIPDDVEFSKYQPRNNNHQNTWNERIKLIDHFEKLIRKVEKGLEILESDSNSMQSFIKTNETFYNYYSTRSKPLPDAGWRLFQFAFLLSSIESIVNESDLDIADVLHVDTGGGKSEAYFSLIIFTSFYERYSGKTDGVTAIVKFPLRMLSIQQLERAAGIIIHAEEVRLKSETMFSGAPFSLGYYVGSNSEDFPDLYAKLRDSLYENKNLKDPAPISKIISICPLCPSGSKGTIHLVEDSTHKRILHKCDQCGKQFYIYLSDREVFRWRPTIIVSTVDKWASLSQQRRVRNILGGSGSMCPDGHGFIPAGDKCEDKKDEAFQCDNVGNNTSSHSGPKLSIQDEMHLLKEGFGTISAHFEGLIEEIVRVQSNRQMKHVAMSATLNGTEKQIKELYNKDHFVIPGRCPEGVGTPNDFFFETKDGPKRIIYGLMPNLRDNHYASLRSILHYAEFIIYAQRNYNDDPLSFCKTYNLKDVGDGQILLNQYLVPLTYHIKKQDAYDMGRLKDAVINDHLSTKFDGVNVEGTVLTGDSNLEELKEAIDNVRKYVADYDPVKANKDDFTFEPLYATSVVSHGVDLDELNIMTFQGLPYSTSEYIQALSRVGRKNLGVIFLWFYPNRVRDSSFYRNFIRYHNSLDHEVRPIPINRFSKLGLQQTINSIFCASILNYLSNKKGKPLYKKKDVVDLSLSEKEDIIEFIENVYGNKNLDINISDEVESRIAEIRSGKDKDTAYFPGILTKSGNKYYRNQSGMRGIQRQLLLDLNSADRNKLNYGGK